MNFLRLNLLFLLLTLCFLGCESKKTYDISSDKAVADMNTQLADLESDLKELNADLDEVRKVLNDTDIDAELRESVRKEIHEGDRHIKDIEQWIDYIKIRRKKRYNSLVDRKDMENLTEIAEKEVEAYFMEQKLKPIEKKWKDRYRTAIEL